MNQGEIKMVAAERIEHEAGDDVGHMLLAALGMIGKKNGAMPLRAFTGIPLYNGHDTSAFLERYNAVADDFEVADAGRIKGLLYYVQEYGDKNILQYVRALPDWKSNDWKGIQNVLRRTFPDEEDTRAKFRIDDLRSVVASGGRIHDLKDLADYYFKYKLVADCLIEAEEITVKEHGLMFFRGLPLRMRLTLEAKERVASGGNNKQGMAKKRQMTLDKIYTDCQQVLREDGAYAEANAIATTPTTGVDKPPGTERIRRRPSFSNRSQEKEYISHLLEAFEDLRVEINTLKESIRSDRYDNSARIAGVGEEVKYMNRFGYESEYDEGDQEDRDMSDVSSSTGEIADDPYDGHTTVRQALYRTALNLIGRRDRR